MLSFPTIDPPAAVAAKYQAVKRLEYAPIRRLIWLYFMLLILEGALRKWIVPSLANPLLIIRDPVVILIYIVALSQDVFPKNGLTFWTIGLGAVSLLASEIGGGGNLLISFYGWRTNFLHLPLIFILPAVFTAEDVHRLAKWLLYTAFPMALLVVAQFRAGGESFLNVGAGGSIGGQMEVSFGRIRPAGTFSFNTGIVDFVGLVAAYVISTQMTKDSPNRKLAVAALPALLIIVAVSGSRTTLGVMALIVLGVAFICIRKPIFFGKGMKGVVVLIVAYCALSLSSEFRAGLSVHEDRLETGGGFQQGIVYRVLNEFATPFRAAARAPFFGKGLGMGTNVAAGLLFGERGFLLAEGELERVVLESGPILGFLYIGLRFTLLVYLARRSLAALDRDNPLPLLIFCAVAPEILYGQFAVPSTLGFAIFNAGFCLAAANMDIKSSPPPSPAPTDEKPVKQTVRGRSVFAERLHGE